MKTMSRRRLLKAGVVSGSMTASAWLLACNRAGGGSAAHSTPAAVSGNAPVAAGIDPETLIPDGIKKNYPAIYQNHWSRGTFSKNQPKYGGVFRTKLPESDRPTLDPSEPVNVNTNPLQLFFNGLVKGDFSFRSAFQNKRNLFKLLLVGDLAEKFEQPDPLTYTFQLRKGVKFHNVEPTNGHELTADDVKFSFDAYRQPEQITKASIFRDVDTIEAVDAYNLKITMKRPAAYFLYSLAGPLPLVFSRMAYEKQGGLHDAKPTGTGPFIFDKHDYRSSITAHKNPDYFVKGRPYLDGVELRWLPGNATPIAAYRAGQIDAFTVYDTYDNVDEILRTEKGKTDINVFQNNVGIQPFFAPLLNRPPFDDVRVRRGLSMALDRDAMIKARFKIGRRAVGFPTDWTGQDYPSTPDQFGPNFAYNPDEAKKQLAAAGAANLTFPVVASTSGTPPDDLVALAAEYWKAIGLTPQIKTVDLIAFNQMLASHQLDGVAFGQSITGGATDLDDYSFGVTHAGAPNNVYGVADPEMNSLTEAQQREFDRAKREQIGSQILKREFDQVNRIWTVTSFAEDFKRPYVQNFVSHEVYVFAGLWALFELADVWFDK